MITIVTRWETSQMPAEIEWQMWRQLRGAFAVKRLVFVPVIEEMQGHGVDQYETMEEALASCTGERVFLEPDGEEYLSSHLDEMHGFDVIFILGNTSLGNTALIQPGDHSYKIRTPQRTHLYGISAAAIALAYWVGQ